MKRPLPFGRPKSLEAAWLPALPFVDGLCAEHYLLHVAGSAAARLRPPIPCSGAA